jgi:ribosomal protein L11 methyltransferase
MGAEKVIAIDNDDWSINNAMENIETNNCSRISLVKAETIEVDEKAMVILANINLNIIIANLSAIKNAAEKTATVLFSGIMTHDEPVIIDALKKSNFEIKQVFHKNDWIALLTIST